MQFPVVPRYNGPLLDRVKPGYLALYEAINELGRARFGAKWTGDEIVTPELEPLCDPVEYRPAIEGPLKFNGVPGMFTVRTAAGFREATTREAALEIWNDALPALAAKYRAACDARQRFKAVARELRDAMSLEKFQAYVWDRKNTGEARPIKPAYWDTDDAERTLDLTHPANIKAKYRGFLHPTKWRAPNEAFASYAGVIDCAVVREGEFRAWLNGAPVVEGEAEPDASTETSEADYDPSYTGLAGKPTFMPMAIAKMKRRAATGVMHDTLAGEAKELAGWLATTYAHTGRNIPKAGALKNALRHDYNLLKATVAQN